MTRITKENPDYGLYCEVVSYPSTSSFFKLDIRLLSLYQPINSPTINATITSKNGKSNSLIIEKYVDKSPDPWLWRWYFQENLSGPLIEPGDNVKVTINASNEKGNDVFEIDCNLDPPSTGKIKEPNPPRLVCAINSTPVRKTDENGSPDASTVETILKHIWKRLRRPMDDVWLGPDGGELGLLPLDLVNDFDFTERWTQEDIENEKWARQFSEMLLCVPYRAFFVAYKLGETEDNLFYNKMEGKLDGNKVNRAYPLTAACQHLATMAVISRGIHMQLNAGYDSADTVGKSNWFKDADTVKALIGDKQDSYNSNQGVKPDLQPGSFFLFVKNPGKPSNQPGDHIAPILRIKRSPLGNKLQLFDTGAMKCRPLNDPCQIILKGPNQYDDPWTKSVKGTNHGLFGCGSVPSPSPENLNKTTEEMIKAVPLGMARLVLMHGDDLIFATPLLDMHTGRSEKEDTKNYESGFSIARFLWSLRELPGRDSIEAQWLIDIPRDKLAKRFLEEQSLHMTPLWKLANGLNIKAPVSNLRLPLIDLTSTRDGTVQVLRSYSFVDSKMIPSKRPQALDDLPPNIQGGMLTLSEGFFDEERKDDNGHIITLSYFKGRWLSVTPIIAPLEGKTRIRIKGTKFSENSTVVVGNTPATDIRISKRGDLLYATIPTGKEGLVDIKISASGKEDVFIPSGIMYVSDVVQTARAAMASFIVHLEELKELAQTMRDANTQTSEAYYMLEIELQLAHRLSYELADNRALITNTPLNSPDVEKVYIENYETVNELIGEVITAIG